MPAFMCLYFICGGICYVLVLLSLFEFAHTNNHRLSDTLVSGQQDNKH